MCEKCRIKEPTARLCRRRVPELKDVKEETSVPFSNKVHQEVNAKTLLPSTAKMTHVECMALSSTYFPFAGDLKFACNTVRDYEGWEAGESYDGEEPSTPLNLSRTSQGSVDSGYLSASPQPSPKSRTYVLPHKKLDRALARGQKQRVIRVTQGHEGHRKDGKESMSPSEEVSHFLKHFSLGESEWEDRGKSPVPMEKLYHHYYQHDSLPQTPTDWVVESEEENGEAREWKVRAKNSVPVRKRYQHYYQLDSLPQTPTDWMAESDEENVEEDEQPVYFTLRRSCNRPVSYIIEETVIEPQEPKVLQYEALKSEVRYLREAIHQPQPLKAFQCEPVSVGQSTAAVENVPQRKAESEHQSNGEVSHCQTEVRPQSRDKTGPHCKEVQPKTTARVEPQTKDISEPQHKDGERTVEPQTKGEEVPPCKCEVGPSKLCEHLKMKLRRKKDPLFGKKRLRRLFRVYVPEDLEEPPFQYVPEVLPTSATIKGVVPPLQESLMLLGEGLEAGSLVAQFEQLYRRKPGLTVTEARRQDNEKKNRYRDISPYDTTRVILTTASSGDYINASYVNMEVQASGIVNRYIASQGPLAGTCTDFWHMVWEQQSTLIVMLTTVVEQGRVKCHRYWPRLYETVDFGILQVTCNKEEETPGFAFREFTLINTETQEERHITHMQYLAWPDHGVPDDSTEFLNFVTQVRKARAGMVEPTIVHCSAGIGRTGVLILMETAQCLIEANEPIYPLDIVKAMRDQRAMMIQTASQFRFVCEAIHRVYTEELIKPLAEYEQR